MSSRNLTVILIVVWVALCGWSFVNYQITAPTDFGFSRGLNRVTDFLEIQILAVLVAILAFVLSFRFPAKSGMRWMARVPVLVTLILVAALGVVIIMAIWNQPAPSAPSTLPPVTEPVTQ